MQARIDIKQMIVEKLSEMRGGLGTIPDISVACRGDGAFHKFLPENSPYCEISEGKDFLLYSGKVDWVIGNPPYSIFEDFLKKGFEIADNVSYLVPTNKVFQRQVIMDMITKWGGKECNCVWLWSAN